NCLDRGRLGRHHHTIFIFHNWFGQVFSPLCTHKNLSDFLINSHIALFDFTINVNLGHEFLLEQRAAEKSTAAYLLVYKRLRAYASAPVDFARYGNSRGAALGPVDRALCTETNQVT